MAQPYLNAPLVKMESSVIPVAGRVGDGDGDGEERGPTFMALFDSAAVTREAVPETMAEGTVVNGTTTIAGGLQAIERHAAIQGNEQPTETPSEIPQPDDPTKSPSSALLAPHAPPQQPSIQSTNATSTSTLPLRTRSSCTNCRKRKQRCDHGLPGEPCRGCAKGGKVCVYPEGLPLAGTGRRSKKKTGGDGLGKGKKGARWKVDADSSKRAPNPQRGNRDFTDSEDDLFRQYTSSHSSPKRETRSARAGAVLQVQEDRPHGDEVDELDEDEEEEEEDEVEEEEEDDMSLDIAAHLPPPPSAPNALSSRYASRAMNGHSAQPTDATRRTDPPSSESSASPPSAHAETRSAPLSRSTTDDPLARSQSRDRVPLAAQKRASDAFRHPVAGGGLNRIVGKSPVVGKSKRKGTVGVTEGDVEGEILALVEEDQRPSKPKKSRHTSPRGSSRSEVPQAGHHPDEGFFPTRPPDPRYVDPRPGAFPTSGRSGNSFSGIYQGTPGAVALSHPASMPPSAHALLGYGQTSAAGYPPAPGRAGSVATAPGMVIGYPQGYAPFPGHPPQHGQPMTMPIPGQPMHQVPHAGRSVYDLGVGSHLTTPTGNEYSTRTGQESIALHPSLATPYAASLGALLAVLPPIGTQQILYQTFFQDAFLAEGVTLLQAPFMDEIRYLIHRRSTQQPHHMSIPNGSMEPLKNGDATTLALAFAILASALRVLPEESSQLLLSSVDPHAYPRSLDRVIQGKTGPSQSEDRTSTPLHRRYMDHALLAATLAETEDSPSIMQVCFKLIHYRYAKLCIREPGLNMTTGHVGKSRPKERNIVAGLPLVQAIKMAQSINLHRERDGGTLFERELRRRVFYALYTADRLHAFETSSPYAIHGHHTSTLVPSAISDSELYQYTTSGHAPALPQYDYTHNPSPLVHLVVMANITKSMTPLLDTLAAHSAADISSEAVDRYDAAFQACEEELPSYYHLAPATNTSYDQQDPYLLFHRLDIQALLYNLRMTLYRPQLNTYLSVKTPHSVRKKLSKLCYRTLRIHRSARIQESKFAFRLFSVERVFEAAFVLGFIARVELAYSVAAASRPPGSISYPCASEESIEDMQQGLVDAIELLEGVTTWPDVGAFAVKTVKILRKVAKLLSASWSLDTKRPDSHADDSVRSHPHTARVSTWLKSWRELDVEALIADADYDDWNKVLRSMQA